jgi:drug/metabolite transporter (DMT)-like permease
VRAATPPSSPADVLAPPRPLLRVLTNAALLATFIFIAGATPSAARDALAEMPPLSAGLARFGIAGLLLLLTSALRSGLRATFAVERRDLPAFLLAGVLCVPLNQGLYLTGVQWASASHAGLFYALNPVIVLLFTWMLGLVRPAWRMAAAALLAFAGAGVIAYESLHVVRSPRFFWGDLMLLGAVVTWAAYTLVIAPLSLRYGALRSVTITILLGTLLYAWAALIDGHRLRPLQMSWRALGGFAFITLLTCYLNYLLWSVALMRIDVNRIAVSVNAGPIVAVVIAHYWHHDPLTPWLLAGSTLILVAITLANWDKLRALRRPSRRSTAAPPHPPPAD